jgi:hypothetical protein
MVKMRCEDHDFYEVLWDGVEVAWIGAVDSSGLKS